MTTQAVHWREGMFMRPQHFQAAHRYMLEQIRRSYQWDVHYCWGLRSIDIDLDALGNERVVIRRLEARLRDGTIVNVPEDCNLPEVPIASALQQSSPLMVFLAVPSLYLGRSNASLSTDGHERFFVETHDTVDENTGGNVQSLAMRRLNVKLLLGDQDQAGYETLPLARIKKSERAEARPLLDETFIPPLLTCDGWQPLQTGFLRAILSRTSQKLELLLKLVKRQSITFDSSGQGDNLILHQLLKLNEAYGVLRLLANAQGVHPLSAYLELCRVVGQLSIFGGERRTPDLPRYDHNDLHKCFLTIRDTLHALLNTFVEPEYRERPFINAGLRMQVVLEPDWLESSYQLYVGVRSSLDNDACVQLLTRPGELDMKIGSSDRVDNIFREGHQGLRFEFQRRPPEALSSSAGWVYFQIKRQTQDAEWEFVQKSLNLALRVKESYIASIQNGEILTIKTQNKTVTMEFRLFAVRLKTA